MQVCNSIQLIARALIKINTHVSSNISSDTTQKRNKHANLCKFPFPTPNFRMCFCPPSPIQCHKGRNTTLQLHRHTCTIQLYSCRPTLLSVTCTLSRPAFINYYYGWSAGCYIAQRAYVASVLNGSAARDAFFILWWSSTTL